MLAEICDDVTDRADAVHGFVRDADIGCAFNGNDQLHGIQRGTAEIVNDVGLLRQFISFHVKLLCYDLCNGLKIHAGSLPFQEPGSVFLTISI